MCKSNFKPTNFWLFTEELKNNKNQMVLINQYTGS